MKTINNKKLLDKGLKDVIKLIKKHKIIFIRLANK